MMDYADTPRQNDLDGRGNLSLRALKEFALWFLKVCLDQVTFMSGLFEIEALTQRFKKFVAHSKTPKPESSGLLEEALMRGEYDRGEAARITGLPERSARHVLNLMCRLNAAADWFMTLSNGVESPSNRW